MPAKKVKKKTKVTQKAEPTKEEALFQKISDKLVSENAGVSPGPMMSSPGIRYKNKVFAFYYKNEMTFRLGKEFNPKSQNITKYSLLNPFKNKPPLAGWFCISYSHKSKWESLAKQAMALMADEQG